MQAEGQEKLLLYVKSLKSLLEGMNFFIAHVQLGWVLHTYRMVELSIVFSRHGDLVKVQVLQ
jgi:hypothetical protein